ncbi:putative aminohydrolase SsnA [Clostridium sp. CM028]|uniref:putative aminohydrolase SsnA n=1 Tax=unclassified Clostridium TaxID=2614128 RepID=UPI001C0C4548|nr:MULTISPECIES: putative aminohydrolase SsnA [unclassified Clostridium]MBU3093563.1 putative aminohydrolase SsnA [Clostridium sp. CF011]MBW9145964.1 putative aminohydrolase SsnA [Clostridium sp. CM027]MBW9149831.1 putative aminohydrolase SsnA [Clostridium sp. CM028]UVE39435.1 putative aminohydrolase SsnA [Clostridium sp. CM027]WAG68340.1 putative aminohydrolase SsnA [Clostridium sp. CF011]
MILIGNGKLLTRDNDNTFIEDGCVCIDANIIVNIGTTEQMKKKYEGAEFIDAKKGLIMPGMINTHHHIYSAFARGLSIKGNNPKSFLDILSGMWWKIDRLLTLEDTEYSAYSTYLDCIRNGVTTVFDHHASYGSISGSLFQISGVAKKLGIRTSLCYEVSDRDGEGKMRQAVKENVEFMKSAKKDSSDMQKGMMGLHASFTLSNKTLEYCAKNITCGAGYHVHTAEGIDDVYDSLKKYNKRIVNRLFDFDILGEKTIAVHCIHINPAEMDLLNKTDTMVVHNPESNMGNAVGCTPVLELVKKGLTLGLGTDGYTSDMFESMKVANILHKHNNCNPSVGWDEIPLMTFKNNAKIANRFFEKPLGIIQKGAYADIIVAEYDPLTPFNVNNANAHILFGINGRCVTTTMINGKVLMKDREIIGVDSEQIMAKSRELSNELWNKINS